MANGDVRLAPDAELGFERSPQLQSRFEEAAGRLLTGGHWRTEDGLIPPGGPELRCDLALEGGGVKGIGLVGAILVLGEAGYRIQRVAGTSAGAIAAALTAALVQGGRPLARLRGFLDTLSFEQFMPEGRVRKILDRAGRPGEIVADVAALADRLGLYPGDYLYAWLEPILADLGVRTFGDLRITTQDDPGMSLPPERQYRLVVHVSDISRHQLVRLPWDYDFYGQDRDGQKVSDAVRASMSIPFFFEPVQFEARAATVAVPAPGGSTVEQHYPAGQVTWVDGGMLRNFPIDAFERLDGKPPRWPTIGIKLSGLETEFPATVPCAHPVEEATSCLRTMMNEWDSYSIEETSAARTIFVDNAGLQATDFNLSADQQNRLFLNGVEAATNFIIEMGMNLGHIPDRHEAGQLAALRRGLTSAARGAVEV